MDHRVDLSLKQRNEKNRIVPVILMRHVKIKHIPTKKKCWKKVVGKTFNSYIWLVLIILLLFL